MWPKAAKNKNPADSRAGAADDDFGGCRNVEGTMLGFAPSTRGPGCTADVDAHASTRQSVGQPCLAETGPTILFPNLASCCAMPNLAACRRSRSRSRCMLSGMPTIPSCQNKAKKQMPLANILQAACYDAELESGLADSDLLRSQQKLCGGCNGCTNRLRFALFLQRALDQRSSQVCSQASGI